MKKLLVISVILFASCSKPSVHDCPPNVQKQKHYTEDTEPYVGIARNLTISVADTIDGRVTYNLSFPDGATLESMYAEEIANGLITGKWDYNEDLQITQELPE